MSILLMREVAAVASSHEHILYIYIYICVCVCECVCAQFIFLSQFLLCKYFYYFNEIYIKFSCHIRNDKLLQLVFSKYYSQRKGNEENN